ncbi:hypothetical protein [Aliiglaciecola sp. M165]|uniref:hypothetical protein n=1 Tax=Aliiglaciecola sp. M165 TaxID=2593649 RepID=UPI00117EAEB7|nr:hypothetical protein [Aliiglaciecola sp. M165]TRY32930.1 hypothetical protein FM019_02770 [Aliiglaciecola sp. M165]
MSKISDYNLDQNQAATEIIHFNWFDRFNSKDQDTSQFDSAKADSAFSEDEQIANSNFKN